MTDESPPPHEKKQITPMGAGVAGALAGAAIGAGVAVALSDAETRKKLQKNIKVLKDKMIKVMDSLEESELKEAATDKIDEVKKKIDENQPFIDQR
jgi:hypothetical protein